MAGVVAEDKRQQKLARDESQREREFYRYFEPIKAWTTHVSAFCDPYSDASVRAHKPVPSPDPALTAFCQLGALRCSTRRAMLFFFDKEYAYVLAEATRSLSLLDNSIHDAADSIWLGHAKIPRGHSVCEHTALHLHPRNNDADPTPGDNSLVYVINDLREDVAFCDRPFVTSGPKVRFYAGVPIRTARGINIGAYCLLDDKPRAGLAEHELKFLRHMGRTVMNHLEMVRAKAQHERATKMVAGIGSFVDSATDMGRGANSESANTLRSDALHRHTRNQSLRNESPTAINTSSNRPSASREQADASPTTSEGLSGHPVKTSETVGGVQTPPSSGESSAADASKASKRAHDLRAELTSWNVRKTFDRAAEFLCSSVDLDGAMYLDARVSSYGCLVDKQDRTVGSGKDSETGPSSLDEATTDSGQDRDRDRGRDRDAVDEARRNKVCTILADSYHENNTRAAAVRPLDERFLERLLRRYPHGKIWNFSSEGVTSSDDGGNTGSNSESLHSAHSADAAPGMPPRKKNRRRSWREDGRRLAEHFPGVRSLALTGIWNQVSGRWYAASIVWTNDKFRCLADDLDMPFLQAFSDVLMAEVHRLEAQKSDRAKVDFISSISHELRSPLHGILGSVECIQEQGTDELTSGLVSSIEACGRTLLDIVNNLLDFSKINYYGRTKQETVRSDNRIRQRQLGAAGKSSQLGSMMSLDTEVSLDAITEEVVDTAFYSFCCSAERETILKRDVAMVLDIERGADVNWWCRIAPGGWKRIIINLVGNAFKYTSTGYIHVSLKRQAGQRKKSHTAILTVKDSGHGMAKAFLEDRLFSAFTQENSFNEGTGLGMNLVATIIRAIGGKIEVQSEQGVGTTVTVQVPLEEVKRGHSRSNTDKTPIRIDTIGLKDLTIAMQGSSSDKSSNKHNLPLVHAASHDMLISSVSKTCGELGIRTVGLDRSSDEDVDIVFGTEQQISDSSGLSRRGNDASNDDPFFGHRTATKPLIILCGNVFKMRAFRSSHADLLASRNVELISQPAGPERIGKAIRTCLDTRAREGQLGAREGNGRSEQEQQTVGDNLGTALSTDGDGNERKNAEAPHSAGPNAESGTAEPSVDDSGLRNTKPGSDTTLSHRSLDATEQKPPTSVHSISTDVRNGTSPNDAVTVRPKTSSRTSSSASSGLTIMLVDDNAINLQLLTVYAKRHGHVHIAAHNGQQAVDAYKAACTGRPLPPHLAAIQTAAGAEMPQKPRVVLMDINMPILNGYEATRAIRDFEKRNHLPPTTVVALTGLGSAQAQQEAYSSGIDLFLTKPVKLKELGQILESVDRE